MDTLEVEGLRLRYEKSGSGSPLILMHGWGCTHETVRSIALTAEATNTVYNIDFPGFGESPEPDSVWGVEEYTRLIERFAAELGIVRPVLIGHSFGGRVAILFASRNDVEKVVLVDAAGIKPSRSMLYYLKIYGFKISKKCIKAIYNKDKAKKIIEKMRKKRGSADYASSSPRMRAILSKVVNEDLSDVLPQIKAPTLLLWGKNDTATPVKDAKKMERLIKDSGLVVFDSAGHYSFLDSPFQFRTVLSTFLKQN